MYTTKTPAHSVTRGMVLGFSSTTILGTGNTLLWKREVLEHPRWVSNPTTKQYDYVIIDGEEYRFNEPVAIVVGAAPGGGMQ